MPSTKSMFHFHIHSPYVNPSSWRTPILRLFEIPVIDSRFLEDSHVPLEMSKPSTSASEKIICSENELSNSIQKYADLLNNQQRDGQVPLTHSIPQRSVRQVRRRSMYDLSDTISRDGPSGIHRTSNVGVRLLNNKLIHFRSLHKFLHVLIRFFL